MNRSSTIDFADGLEQEGTLGKRRETAIVPSVTKLSQQPPVKPEINPQPLGNGEDKLPMRNGRADFSAHPLRGLQRPFLVAAWTKAPASARERHEKLMAAIRTSSATGKPESLGGALRVKLARKIAGICQTGIPVIAFTEGVMVVIGNHDYKTSQPSGSSKPKKLRGITPHDAGRNN